MTDRMDEARAAYDALRERALREHPEHADYIRDLGASWAVLLAGIDDYPDHRVPYIAHLMREIANPENTNSLEWLDAFPSTFGEWAGDTDRAGGRG